ncbi:glycosyltransferase [Rubricoccus marinus]|uniref:Glycosyl transferase family 28 C-terminal domain-containing protein n=1 Tax=Rubricoccus marinus TaxID=716817 RepID=A0A259U448_9BACT|nr:glycosyltransferase [Rubricoccus marinus]OZC04617.1 hypothetical protein BSZ36_06120 [Rubricoccus marinus]
MTEPARIGYYAHHHGRGHVARALAILARVRAAATLFTSAPVPTDALPPNVGVCVLPPDLPRPGGEEPPPGGLHYAPLAHPGVCERMAAIAAWAARGPALMVVDVSVEVAVFARLLSLPVVVVRQHGERTDAPHQAAYEAAVACLAPFPEALESPGTPETVRRATVYAGGLSRFAGRARPQTFCPRTVCLVGGGGSGGPESSPAWTSQDVADAARATPGWTWTWVGGDASTDTPASLRTPGWIDDPFPLLASSEVVVASGGHNATMEAAAAGRPLVVIPEARPFQEQVRKAEALARAGAATALERWPAPEAWADILDRASRRDPAPLRALADPDAPARAAQLLDDLAVRYAV